MEKRRNRGASRLQFSKDEQTKAVRAGQPKSSHLPLLHQGIHAAHAQLHHQAAEADLREAALKNGMTLMRDDGERLVQAGITTREELVRVTRD